MPEGDTIFRAARTLHRVLAGDPIETFETVYPHLSRVDVDSPIVGRTVESVEASGKWQLIRLSGDLILLTHMLMSGSWHIYRPGERWQRPRRDMRVLLSTQRIIAVAFNVQIAEFHNADTLRRRRGFNKLGPSLLGSDFDTAKDHMMARLVARPELEVGVALLTQSLLAGIGNVFKSEVCFACGVNPFRLVGTLEADERTRLIETARKFMMANISEASGDGIITYTGSTGSARRNDQSSRSWVYGRRGEACRKCGGAIESFKQGLEARTTFWCPTCQPLSTSRSAAIR